MPDKPTHLSVSIVLYHSPLEQLQVTLCSLYASCRQACDQGRLGRMDVTLVDNSCSADYRARVETLVDGLGWASFGSCHYEEAPRNDGFGRGHNRALLAAQSDVHLVLNPDVRLAEDALEAGLAALEQDGNLVLASPRVAGASGEQEFLCKSYPSVLVLLLRAFAPGFIRRRFQSRLDHYEMRQACSGGQRVEVRLASGCFMLVRTRVLQAAGGFDPAFFLYFEDFDLSLRLRQHGRLEFLPAMQITHYGGYAAGKGLRHIWLFFRSGFRFFQRYGWKWI